jgi:hypothetical protein
MPSSSSYLVVLVGCREGHELYERLDVTGPEGLKCGQCFAEVIVMLTQHLHIHMHTHVSVHNVSSLTSSRHCWVPALHQLQSPGVPHICQCCDVLQARVDTLPQVRGEGSP